MVTIVWLVLCLFASIGLVQSVAWLIANRKRPKKLRRGYYVIPLYDKPDLLEAQVQYSLTQARWSGSSGAFLVLVDMGLGEECLALCDKLLDSTYGVFYCKAESLPDTLSSLDDLQTRNA